MKRAWRDGGSVSAAGSGDERRSILEQHGLLP